MSKRRIDRDGCDSEVHEAQASRKDLCRLCYQAFQGLIFAIENREFEEFGFLRVRGHHTTKHHSSLASLLDAAQCGCRLCDYFRGFMFERNDDEFKGYYFEIQFLLVDLDVSVAPSSFASFTFLFSARTLDHRSDSTWDFEFTERDGVVPQFAGRQVVRLPCLELGKQWIDCCQRHHEECPPLIDRTLPSRLLDVGQGEKEVHLRLVESAHLPSTEGRYIALSHCWGSPPPDVVLRTTNITKHLESMDIHSLARNFQDAVTVTRSLGYRFLWIDSLCIIQDSEADWQVECSRMEMVYANAALTVAAAAAPDSRAGFLGERQLPCGRTCEFELPVAKGPPSDQPPSASLMRNDMGSDGVSNTHRVAHIQVWYNQKVGIEDVPALEPQRPPILDSRGWVLQERLLSSRLLSFGSRQMYFQCVCAQWFEASHWPVKTVRWLNRTEARWLSGPLDDSKTNVADTFDYYGIVQNYTQCRLSRIDDRLAAFSGIARRCQRYIGDEYYAGIWRNDIRGLTWAGGASSSPDPLAVPCYHPPSWSWASSTGSVSFLADANSKPFVEESSKPFAEIVAMKTFPVGYDSFGQVNGGELILDGFTRSCRICGEEVKLLKDQACLVAGDDDYVAWFHRDGAASLSEPLGSSKMAICLLLTRKPDPDEDEKSRSWTALALEPVSGRADIYQRIGLVYCSSWDEEFESEVDESLQWLQSGPRKTLKII